MRTCRTSDFFAYHPSFCPCPGPLFHGVFIGTQHDRNLKLGIYSDIGTTTSVLLPFIFSMPVATFGLAKNTTTLKHTTRPFVRSAGNFSCGYYQGLEGHYEADAQLMAEWQVDSIKVRPGCRRVTLSLRPSFDQKRAVFRPPHPLLLHENNDVLAFALLPLTTFRWTGATPVSRR